MWPPSTLWAPEEWRWGEGRAQRRSKMLVLLGVPLITLGPLKFIPSLDQTPVAAALGRLPGCWI